jgi:DNA-binding helix-hairpin-helix protein with protein kinase domain
MTALLDDQGRPLRIGAKIGQGGEGAVYRLRDDPGIAVKIYSRPMAQNRAIKIANLSALADPQLDRFIARPRGLVRDVKGKPKGLLLPMVDQGADIHNLYTPASRRNHFPTATWQFLAHVAGNVARAFSVVHQAGLVIGDVNPGSILVLKDGTVRLIDVDSFQVPGPAGQSLLCTVWDPMFLPPELKGAPLDQVPRTPDHDCFGLAVTLFQLLMLGRHPFAGRYLGPGDMPVDQAVAEERFAYGSRRLQLQMEPPPHTVGLEILPGGVSASFEEAFAARTLRLPRPTAVRWAQELEGLRSSLVPCKQNAVHQYWASLRDCPWCRLERAAGVTLFASHPPSMASRTGIEQDYKRLCDLFDSMRLPGPPQRPKPMGSVNADPEAVAARRTPPAGWALHALGGVFVAMGLAMLAQGGLVLMALGVALFVGATDTRAARRRPWVVAHKNATSAFDQAVLEFNRATSYPTARAARDKAMRARHSWDQLPAWRKQQLQQLEAGKRAAQLRRHLESHLIERAEIKGVGPSRLATLSAYGIDTAWDVDVSRVQSVPQFGPVLAQRLADWRRGVERKFVFRPQAPIPAEAIAELDRQMIQQRRQIVKALSEATTAMRTAIGTEPAAAAEAARRLSHAQAVLGQATADVTAATGRTSA